MDIITRYFDEPFRDGRVVDFLVPERVTRPVAIFGVHGGGWTGGARQGQHKVLGALAREGYACAATDYRLCAGGLDLKMEDIRLGYDMFRRHLRDCAIEVDGFVTFGSSAGAHLSALTAMTEPGAFGEDTGALELPWLAPQGCVLSCGPVTFEPWEDIFPPIWASMVELIGRPWEEAPELYRQASPCEHVRPDGPALLLPMAENEHMFLNELTLESVERWRAESVDVEARIYPRCEHGFLYDVTRPGQRDAFADMLAWLETRFG